MERVRILTQIQLGSENMMQTIYVVTLRNSFVVRKGFGVGSTIWNGSSDFFKEFGIRVEFQENVQDNENREETVQYLTTKVPISDLSHPPKITEAPDRFFRVASQRKQ